jgi:hypothetical protein
MNRNPIAVLPLMLLISVSPAACAFWDQPYVTPVYATPDDTIFVNVSGGVCDGIFDREGYPKLTQEGAVVRIVFAGLHIEDFEFCTVPIGAGPLPVGSFPAGEYVLQVDVAYDDFSGPQIFHMGEAPFVVHSTAARPSTPVPALGFLSASILTLATALLGAQMVSRGRVSRRR